MSISKDNIQCTTILSRDVIAMVDKLAKNNMRTRSSQIAYMVSEYLREQEKKNGAV